MYKKIFTIGLLLVLVSGISGLTAAQEIKRGLPPGHPGNLIKARIQNDQIPEKPAKAGENDYGERITFTTNPKYYIDWSPDGQWIAYEEEGDIRVVPAVGGEPTNLTATIDGYCSDPCFAPDNSGVTFTMYDYNTSNYSIEFIDFTGTTYTAIMTNALAGCYSHDGRYLAYRVYSTSALALYDIQTGANTAIFAGDWEYGRSCFTADDQYIITTVVTGDGTKKLFAVPLSADEQPFQISFGEGSHAYPEASPDGKWILYTDIDTFHLYALNLETFNSQPVFPDSENWEAFSGFSPEEDRFCYHFYEDVEHNDVYIADFPDFGEPHGFDLVFKYETLDWIGQSAAIGSDGTIYIGSGQNFYAINPDGSLKWEYPTDGWIDSSTAIESEGTIYIVSGNILYAINPDGSLKWKSQELIRLFSSPAIGSDGTIYIGSSENYVYAINPDGSLKWEFKEEGLSKSSNSLAGNELQKSAKEAGFGSSSIVIGGDGTIYHGSCDQNLYALNPDGSFKWKYYANLSSWAVSSPAIDSDGTIYIGSDDYNLYAINADGSLKWKYKTDGGIWSSSAIGIDGTIYIGSWDGNLYAINADGSLKWKYKTDSAINSSPAIGSDGTIYIGSDDYNLYAINADGSLKWKYQTDEFIMSSPALGNTGIIYFGSGNYLYAIDSGTGIGLAESPWPKFRHDLQNTGRVPVETFIKLDSPTGGEQLTAGQDYDITWTSGEISEVKLEYSTDNGSTWILIMDNIPAENGSFTWNVPDIDEPNCLMRIQGTVEGAVYEYSSGNFSITKPPYLRITAPNSSETWNTGSTQYITWDARDASTITIEYSTNDGNSWSLVATGVDAMSKSYQWIIPDTPSTECRVKITDESGSGVSSTSYAKFTIRQPVVEKRLRIIVPNYSVDWEAGTTQKIEWESSNIQYVDILYCTTVAETFTLIASKVDASQQSYLWDIPDTPSTDCRVLIVENIDGNWGMTTKSYAKFTISPSYVTIPDPNLESAIRDALNKPEGPITEEDLAVLTALDPSERDIIDLTGIEHCVNLQWLELHNNQISDLSPLSNMANLNTLSLYDNQISDISPLSNLTNLHHLHLQNNQISDISPLSSLTNLEGLVLNDNQIIDINTLSNLTNLHDLHLADNQISDLSPLSGLTNLSLLFLCENQISDIGPLSSLTSLENLSLGGNQIIDIRPLSSLTSLENLSLGGNQIIDIRPLSSLTNLQALLLDYNRIGYLNPLSNLIKLRILLLDSNLIQDISPLAELEMIGEEVESVYSEERDGVIIHLGLSDNQISDISPLVSNTGIGEGDGINLRGNPLTNEAHETHIPALQARGASVLFDSPGEVTITLSAPNGGEVWIAGSTQIIKWTSQGVSKFDLVYSTDGGITWTGIVSNLIVRVLLGTDQANRQYAWDIPDTPSTTCRVRIYDTDNHDVFGESAGNFKIKPEAVERYIEVLTPNGGEEWFAGETYDIEWDSDGIANVQIWYTPDSGIRWFDIITSVPADSGYYSWTIPDGLEISSCHISVGDPDDNTFHDVSDEAFSILAEPFIEITYPDGGETIQAGSTLGISWDSGGVNNVHIECSPDDGINWIPIIYDFTALNGYYEWKVPDDIESTRCIIWIGDADNEDIEDESDDVFTITKITSYVEVTYPDSSETIEAGSTLGISWDSGGVNKVNIEYSIDGGINWINIVYDFTASDGYYEWAVPEDIESTQCIIRIGDADNEDIEDESAGLFTIEPAWEEEYIDVIYPDGGEILVAGEENIISWESVGVPYVDIYFTIDGGDEHFEMIAEDVDASSGSYQWTIATDADIESSDCYVILKDSSDDTDEDWSDNAFTITQGSLEPFIAVTYPGDGQEWEEETEHDILWQSGMVSQVSIEYSTDDGGSWVSIISNVDASAGSYEWTVPEGEYDNCLVRISDASDFAVNDVSGIFRIITSDSINITAPVAGDKWTVNTDKEIRWQVKGVANVSIEVSYDDGNTWAEMLAGSVDAYSGSYSWTVPDTPVGQCRIRISDTTRPDNIFVISDSFELIRPELTIAHTPQTEAHENEEIIFTAVVTATADIKSVIFSYNKMGESESKITNPMVLSGENTYSYTLPVGVFVAPGIEYRIVATDVNNVEGSSPVDVGLHSINAIVPEMNSTNEVKGGSEQTAYRMISIPLELKATSIVEQIENSIPLGDTGTHWRLFRYPAGSTVPYEYPDIEPFWPGRAFWLISVNNFVLKTPEGKTVPTAEPFQIELKSGWNDIANPWMFNIAWADIENPGNANLSALYTYEGQWSDPTKAPDTLESWKGYAVRNMESGNRIIRLRTKSMTEKPAVPPDTEIWKLSIKASAGEALDTANHLGVRHDASMEWDKYDHVEPPPVGKYVSVSFPHYDWSEYPYNYTVDYRPPGNTISWDFNVKTNISRETVNVELAGIDNLPDGLSLVLIDRDIDERIDVIGDSFSFVSANDVTERHFTLLVTDSTEPEPEQADVKPGEFVTANCFPNPFNPQTTLRYELSKAGKVKISVFNSLGQVVRTYEPGYMAQGIHELVFDAVELTSGLYIYRIDAGYASVTGKMLYMK